MIKKLLGTFVIIAALSCIITNGVNAVASDKFYHDDGTSDDCDIMNREASSAACNNFNIVVKAGQTTRVPTQYVHARAYFVADGSEKVGGKIEPVFNNDDEFRIRISGADLCVNALAGGVDGSDKNNNGHFENANINNGTKVTKFSVSENVKYVDAAKQPGNPLGQKELEDSQPYGLNADNNQLYRDTEGEFQRQSNQCEDRSLIVHKNMFTYAEGLTHDGTPAGRPVFYVNIIARHIDRYYPASGSNKACQNIESGSIPNGNQCDGLTNGFYFFQEVWNNGGKVNNSDRKFGVGSVGRADNDGDQSMGVSTHTTKDATSGYSMRLRFGADCTVEDKSPARITLYDLDYAPDHNGDIRFVLTRTAKDGTKYFLGPQGGSPVQRGNGGNSGPPPSWGRFWQPGSNFETGNFPNGQTRYDKTDLRLGGPNNAGYTYLNFMAYEGDRYTLYLMNVMSGTLNQYSLPFASIYYKSPCQDPGTFSLRPQLSSIANSQPVEPGDSLTPRANINKIGPDPSQESEYQLTLAKFKPGTSPANPTTVRTDNNSRPCAYAISMGANSDPGQCSRYGNGTNNGNRVFSDADTPVGDGQGMTVGNDAPGTRLCFFTSVNKYRSANLDDNDWRHSQFYCVIVGKLPKLQVKGHDARVEGIIKTSLSTLTDGVSTKSYGSWGEYGVLSNGTNTRMGSGKGLFSGASLSDQGVWSDMTFANLPPYGMYGGVSNPKLAINSTRTVDGDLPINARTYSSSSPDKREVVKVRGTLFINGNVTYADTGYLTISDIPRVIYMADRIVIADNVERIDPWLVANKISTCAGARQGTNYFVPMSTANLTFGRDPALCENQLTFNGPVIAGELYPYRTFGSRDDAAEIFNLRADAFLSSYSGPNPEPSATPSVVTELPPRF